MAGVGKLGEGIVDLSILNELIGGGCNERGSLSRLVKRRVFGAGVGRGWITSKSDRTDTTKTAVLVAVVALEGFLEQSKSGGDGSAVLLCAGFGTVEHLGPLVMYLLGSQGA